MQRHVAFLTTTSTRKKFPCQRQNNDQRINVQDTVQPFRLKGQLESEQQKRDDEQITCSGNIQVEGVVEGTQHFAERGLKSQRMVGHQKGNPPQLKQQKNKEHVFEQPNEVVFHKKKNKKSQDNLSFESNGGRTFQVDT